MQPDMSRVVSRFAQDLVQISQSADMIINGEKQPSVKTTRAIRGVIQPSGGKDLLMLPEADRVKSVFSLWTTADVKANNDISRTPADEFEFSGYRYKALVVYPRKINGFNKVILEQLND